MKGLRILVAGLVLACSALPAAVVEDFEAPSANWSGNSLWHLIDANTVGCAGAHSGTGAYYFGIPSQCNYDNGLIKDGKLTGPPLTVTGAGDTNFSFWTKWEIESISPACYDQLWIERQDNGTGPWFKQAELGPVSDLSSSSPSLGYASGSGLGGQPQWQFVQINLSAFVGTTVRFRFRFLSSACLAASCGGETCGAPDASFDHYLGWVIDDIALGCAPGALTLAKSANPGFAKPGDTVTYSITAQNWDAGTQSLSVWDSLPAGMNFVSASNGGSYSGGLVSWSLAGLASMAAQSLQLLLVVDPSVGVPSDITNVAQGSSSAGGADALSPLSPVKVRPGGLLLTKSASPSSVKSGDLVTFNISLSNYNPADIPLLDLRESLPAGFTVLGVYPDFSSGSKWLVSGLLAGETRAYTVWGYAGGSDVALLVNKVSAFIGSALQVSATASVSVTRPVLSQLSIRSVYPNPAPSDNASFARQANVYYETNEGLDVTLSVFTVAGEKVRSISKHAIKGKNSIAWDLKNEAGLEVASGIYVLRVWAAADGGIIEAWAHLAVLK